ncbi:MAG: hypothetical protein AABN95_21295 [Acidobacteriota bacterium]
MSGPVGKRAACIALEDTLQLVVNYKGNSVKGISQFVVDISTVESIRADELNEGACIVVDELKQRERLIRQIDLAQMTLN